MNWWNKWRRPVRVVVRVVVRVPEMNEEELRAAFAVSEQHPLWRATLDLLQREIDQAVNQATAPQIVQDYGALAHCCGGAEWLRSFQARLLDAREIAMKHAEEKG